MASRPDRNRHARHALPVAPTPPARPETARAHLARLWRIARGRPRLWSCVALSVATYGLLPAAQLSQAAPRALVAWNAGALLYLALALHMVWQSDTRRMQRRAVLQGEGRLLVLALVAVSAVAVLLAVASQLAVVKDLPGAAKAPHAALAGLTVVTSWLFTQTLFALNYAHDFYLARAGGGPDVLTFPGTPEPNYGDFFYFACVIGTSGQTADIAFHGSGLRPVGTLHCILAFLFNTTVLALTINIAASLF